MSFFHPLSARPDEIAIVRVQLLAGVSSDGPLIGSVMADETVTDKRRWARWRGSPEDVVRLAERMEQLLVDAGMPTGDESEFARDETKVSVSLSRTSSNITYSSAAEAAEHLPRADLTDLDSIGVTNSPTAGLSLVVYFFQTGTRLEVAGSGVHHIKVAGIADDLASEIDRGDRSLPHPKLIVGGLVAAWAILLTSSVIASGTPGLILGIVAIVPVLVGPLIFTDVLIPHLEIVRKGELSRTERWGGRMRGIGIWGATIVASAALGVLLTKWLG